MAHIITDRSLLHGGQFSDIPGLVCNNCRKISPDTSGEDYLIEVYGTDWREKVNTIFCNCPKNQ